MISPVEYETGRAQNDLIGCHFCGLVQRLPEGFATGKVKCCRCGTVIERYISGSRRRTLALSLAALFLYAPANLYPVMTMDLMGRHSENTVWAGVVNLWQDHMWFIAGIVFVASILFPVMKLLGLFFLALNGSGKRPRGGTWIYKIICRIGPWAMLDVFLLAVAVALIKFGKFGKVTAGPGIVAFCAVVALTLLASSSFDPRLIWKDQNE